MAPDPLMAGKNFGRACDLGLDTGCVRLADFVQHGGDGVFSRACDRSDSVSCFILGLQLEQGVSMPADPVRAASLFERSCATGWARGCGVLGRVYRRGAGVPADFARAMENYAKGCQGNDAPSCAEAASMYRSGEGVMPNEIAARQLNQRACELGLRSACEQP